MNAELVAYHRKAADDLFKKVRALNDKNDQRVLVQASAVRLATELHIRYSGLVRALEREQNTEDTP